MENKGLKPILVPLSSPDGDATRSAPRLEAVALRGSPLAGMLRDMPNALALGYDKNGQF